MRIRSRLILSAAFIGVAAPALAADYDPPIVVQDAPEQVPVEVGSGWYLRGDIAYSTNDSYRHADFGYTPEFYSEDNQTISGSVGIGYHFNDYLRGDLNLGYMPGNDFHTEYDDGVQFEQGDFSNHAWYGMANGYVDLGTFAGFTPYVGAGAGLFQAERKARSTLSGPGYYEQLSDNEKQYSFAYTLNAGIAYKATRNLSVDLGYQYLSAPNAEYVSAVDANDYEVRKGIDQHQIRVGLRYDLW